MQKLRAKKQKRAAHLFYNMNMMKTSLLFGFKNNNKKQNKTKQKVKYFFYLSTTEFQSPTQSLPPKDKGREEKDKRKKREKFLSKRIFHFLGGRLRCYMSLGVRNHHQTHLKKIKSVKKRGVLKKKIKMKPIKSKVISCSLSF